MSESADSPFFDVPVRWFEIPMNTARWGFMRPSEILIPSAPQPPADAGKAADQSGTGSTWLPADHPPAVGRILSEHA